MQNTEPVAESTSELKAPNSELLKQDIASNGFKKNCVK